MQSKFDFLDEKFPKIADYGKKAEECISSDKNICLLNLGRIAEKISEFLCSKNKIEIQNPDELLRLGIIDYEIHRKILTLTEVKDDAVNNDYESEMACERLIDTAVELCKWFIAQEDESRFSFLKDFFSVSEGLPVLAELAEFGKEAEENLFLNTRYSVICMGDIGESITYILLKMKNIPYEKDQIDRIKMLLSRSIISKGTASVFHKLRMARNQAIHSRFILKESASGLLNDSLSLCEAIFKFTLNENDFVKAKITDITPEKNIEAKIGGISCEVDENEIPSENFSTLKIGDKKIFRVIKADNEIIKLSLKDINSDCWKELERSYEKYEVGQDVNVIIRNITKTMGASVELKDGLCAKIPDSELGRKIFNRSKGIKYEVKARIKWFDPKHYPYIILSVKDIEDEQRKINNVPLPEDEDDDRTGCDGMPDSYFIDYCKKSKAKVILQELEKGANPNAKTRSGTTALMTAANYNKDNKVLEALIKAGANVNARNNKGRTALIFAAMNNTPQSVKILLDSGADVNISDCQKRKAIYYAQSNKRLQKEKTLLKLLKGQKISEKISPANNQPNKQIIAACRRGIFDEVLDAVTNGADVNFVNNNGNTPLMIASQFSDVNVVNLLIERGADINHQNSLGNTALHVAASYASLQTVEALLNAGADINIKNKKGLIPYDIAQKRNILKNSGILEKMKTETEINADYQKNFIKICRAGTEQEILRAIESGVNVNVKNKALSTALMFAARYNTAEAVEILIKAGANLNAQDIYGNTALIYAASFNTDDVVKVLTEGGADAEIKNIAGYKAVDYAKQNYRLEDSDVMKNL